MSSKNKDRKQYFKEYAEKNKDKLNKDCICEECGGKYKYVNKANHEKTNKHQNNLLLKKLQKDNEAMKNIISDIGKKIENI